MCSAGQHLEYASAMSGRIFLELKSKYDKDGCIMNDFQRVFSLLLSKYLEECDKYCLADAIFRIHCSKLSPLEVQLPILCNALEIIETAWINQERPDLKVDPKNGKTQYLSNDDFDNIMNKYITMIESELKEKSNFYAKIVEKIKYVNDVSVGAQHKYFFSELKINFSKDEKKARDYRNKLTHWRMNEASDEEELRKVLMLTNKFKILLSRIIVLLLGGSEMIYNDYTQKEGALKYVGSSEIYMAE
jgi:hypothetical protein